MHFLKEVFFKPIISYVGGTLRQVISSCKEDRPILL